VWIEVLAQRLGLTYDPDKNWSFFGHYSPNLVTNVGKFVAPPDANSALFIIWINNADFVYFVTQYAPYSTNNLAVWTNAINQSLSNHFTALQILHGKGARTFVLPNAADLTKVPYYVGLSPASKSFIRQRVVDFNLAFAAKLSEARAAFPGITILAPDIFALLERFLAHPADYGLTNALLGGQSVDALSDPSLRDKSLNGPGADYVFWDYLDPSARAQAVMADITQQLLFPARITQVTHSANNNQLDLVNLPLGLNGALEGSTNLLNWTAAHSFASTNAAQTLFVPASEPWQFYRLSFSFAWFWP